MINAQQLATDLKTHHIEGIAREGNTPFSCPLISQVNDTLWQGGCIDGANLQGYFSHIVSLYPWEAFNPGGVLDSSVSVRLYDGPIVPDETQLVSLAYWINVCRSKGRTLVHCQAGLNRSGLLTGLALVLEGMPAVDAIELLRVKRCRAVLCNSAFEHWLLEYKAQ